MPDSELNKIAQSLDADTSAIILLIEDVETEKAIDSARGLDAQVLKFILADEVSGDIAMAIPGELSFDAD